MVSSRIGCEATVNGCNRPFSGWSRTRAKVDNHKPSRGVSQSKLGPRWVLTALSRTIIVLAGKMMMNPTKRLPIKCPMIGGPAGIRDVVRMSPRVIIVAARLMSGDRGVKFSTWVIMVFRNCVTTSLLASIGFEESRTFTVTVWDAGE